MSELKAYLVYTPREGVVEGLWKSYSIRIKGEEVYLKSEADKVIAEKDKELCHANYRRCVAMADFCEDKLGTVVKPGWWDKWRKRWLELAEKFKPDNSTAQ